MVACLGGLGADIGIPSRWHYCGSAARGALPLMLLGSASRFSVAAFAVSAPLCGHRGLSRWDLAFAVCGCWGQLLDLALQHLQYVAAYLGHLDVDIGGSCMCI